MCSKIRKRVEMLHSYPLHSCPAPPSTTEEMRGKTWILPLPNKVLPVSPLRHTTHKLNQR